MTLDQPNPDEEDEDKAKDTFSGARSEKTLTICGQSIHPVFGYRYIAHKGIESAVGRKSESAFRHQLSQ